MTWLTGGTYQWDAAALSSVDKLRFENLNFLDLDATHQFTININDLGLSADPGWSASGTTSWCIAANDGSTSWNDDLLQGRTLFNVVAPGSLATNGPWHAEINGSDLYLWHTYVPSVPEPGTMSLLAFGALALLGRRRKK